METLGKNDLIRCSLITTEDMQIYLSRCIGGIYKKMQIKQ